MNIRAGATRWVLLIGAIAVKVPTTTSWKLFLTGILCNLQEREFSKAGWPELCPVLFSCPFGFLVVMRRAEELADAEFESFNFDAFYNRDEYVVPVENKRDSFGKLDGRIVAVDYGS